jgi:hypothetical protein
MQRITFAQALPGYRLQFRFDDSVKGVGDLSAEVGKGVFAILSDPEAFARFRIERNGPAIIWSDEVDACADALYLEITGLTAEQLWLVSNPVPVHA